MAPTMFKAVAASALVAVANAHGAMVTPCVPKSQLIPSAPLAMPLGAPDAAAGF